MVVQLAVQRGVEKGGDAVLACGRVWFDRHVGAM
jgi:hypothetical protein